MTTSATASAYNPDWDQIKASLKVIVRHFPRGREQSIRALFQGVQSVLLSEAMSPNEKMKIEKGFVKLATDLIAKDLANRIVKH